MANDRNVTCDQLLDALDEYLDERLGAIPRGAVGAPPQGPASPLPVEVGYHGAIEPLTWTPAS